MVSLVKGYMDEGISQVTGRVASKESMNCHLPELIKVWLGAGVAVLVKFMPTVC